MFKKPTLLAAILATTMLAAPHSFAADKKAAAPVAASTKDTVSKADSDMQRVLDAQASLKPKPIETLSPAEARKQPTPSDGVKLILKNDDKNPSPPLGVTVKDVTYPTAGGTQPARIYMPSDVKKDEKLPVIVYYHGGGWVIADLDVYDSTPRALSKAVNAIVVSVEYRHAPENKFPAAHDDSFAAYKWVLQNAASWGGDVRKVAVAGESAGGNLAINTAIKARDEGIQTPVHELLVYPVAGVDMNTPSYQENANAKPLNKAMMAWFVKHTIKSDADKQDPRLDIIGKANLKGLPPTTIITAGIDPLRSDGEMLAKKLEAAGVKVNAENYSGATHEFFGMGLVVDAAKEANTVAVSDLKSSFSDVE